MLSQSFGVRIPCAVRLFRDVHAPQETTELYCSYEKDPNTGKFTQTPKRYYVTLTSGNYAFTGSGASVSAASKSASKLYRKVLQ